MALSSMRMVSAMFNTRRRGRLFTFCFLGTPATTSQMAKDVVTFLNWAAEPEHDERKKAGLKAVILFSALTAISLYVKRFKWSLIKSRKIGESPPSRTVFALSDVIVSLQPSSREALKTLRVAYWSPAWRPFRTSVCIVVIQSDRSFPLHHACCARLSLCSPVNHQYLMAT